MAKAEDEQKKMEEDLLKTKEELEKASALMKQLEVSIGKPSLVFTWSAYWQTITLYLLEVSIGKPLIYSWYV